MTVSITQEMPGLSGGDFDLRDYISPELLSRVSGLRVDAASTDMFLRDLTTIIEQTYDVKYPEFKARQILSVDTRVNPGAESFVWRQFDKLGTVKIVDSYSEDFPQIDVKGQEFQTRVVSLGASYAYNMQEMRAALMAGIPLETRRATQVRRAMAQAVEQIAAFGVAQIPGGGQQGLLFVPATPSTTDYLANFGLLNFPNVLNAYSTTSQFPGQVTGAGTTTGQTSNNWVNPATTVNSILADLNLMQRTMVVASKGVHTPNTMLVGTQVYSTLSTVARAPAVTDDSILQFIQKQSPWIRNVIYWPMLDTAGKKQDNATAGERVVLLDRNSEYQQLVIPQEFEQLPPQQINMSFRVPCHMRCAGVTVRYPFSLVFLDGATG